MVHGLRRRPVDRTVCRSLLLNAHFTADQLTRLFVARASSLVTSGTPRHSVSSCSRSKWAHFTARTSPAMPGTPRCSDLASFAWDSSVLEHRRLCRGLLAPRCSVIDSDVGDSSLLSARSSPATPGTPRSSVLGHRQRRRRLLAPQCSVITSNAGDSSLLGAWSSPATPGTPRSSVLGPHQLHRGLLRAQT